MNDLALREPRSRTVFHNATLVACIAVLGVAGNGARDTIEFSPSEGAELTKTFEMDVSMRLDSVSFIVNGQDFASMMGELDAMLEAERLIVVSDRYGELAADGPDTLTRTFDTLSGSSTASFSAAGDSQDQDASMESELEGKTVVFTRGDDGYEVAFADGDDDADEDLLENLEEDMDLRFLLPEDDVDEGDTWEVPLSDFLALLQPGGNLGLGGSDDEADEAAPVDVDEMLESFQESLDEILEGTCVCTYNGTREIDGVEVGEITLEITVSSTVDLVELITSVAEDNDQPAPDFEFADLNIDVEAEGTLFWNLATGLLHSLELSSDGEVAIDVAFEMEMMPGESASAEASIEVALSMKHSVTTE